MKWFAVVALFVLILTSTACGGISPERQAALEVARTLTALHESTVRAVIEHLELVKGSLEAAQNSGVLQAVMTGPALELWQASGYEPGDAIWVTRDVVLDEVRVLEYSTTLIRAVACGHTERDVVTYNGGYIDSLPQRGFRNYYIFIWEGDAWKLHTGINFMDSDAVLWSWENHEWSDSEMEFIGDLPSIIRDHFNCGMRPW